MTNASTASKSPLDNQERLVLKDYQASTGVQGPPGPPGGGDLPEMLDISIKSNHCRAESEGRRAQ